MRVDQSLLRIRRHALVMLAFMVAGGIVVQGVGFGISVLIGGGIALLNFHALTRLSESVLPLDLTPAQRAPRLTSVLHYVGRLVLISLALFAIIQISYLSLIGAVLGLSVVIISGLLEAVFAWDR